MHKLISIDHYEMTRDLNLVNLDTNTLDVCFDDSEVTSFDNFDFMKIENTYDCKIYLFGEPKSDGLEFQFKGNLNIGNRSLVEVVNNFGDVYYIEKNNLAPLKIGDIIKFEYTRKDIIQVNDHIHPDFITKN